MKSFIAASAFAAIVAASPCPYGQLAERGALPAADAKSFFDSRSEGEAAVKKLMRRSTAETHAAQAEFYKKQMARGELSVGGGLLGGVLQPFTGVLQDLDVPVPQDTGLAIIPDADHPYIAPTADAVRGMCPTLNTMANHGYLSRDGITTFAEAANACQITLGFGYDTCTFLSALGLLTGGDLISGKYSIGGADSRVPDTLGPSLGISRHGFFEVDNSISRIDAALGNQANFNLDRFNRLVSIADKYNGEFGNSAFAEERVLLYNEAKNDNPEFNAGVRWLAVTTAERVFIFRALPNGTHEDLADYQNVAPFYMNETFPENWFRRDSPYTLAGTGADIANLLASSSEVTVPGANEGLNNFTPIGMDISNVTPFTATCFLATAIFDETPGFIAPGIAANLDLVNAFLSAAVKPFFSDFNCPILSMAAAGPNATSSADGVSTTCNILVNGEYQCE